MSVFIRRFLSDPGEEVLLEIESVNILDLDPPASITGVGTGTVCIVGEFENGPFETPTEVADSNDFVATFGSLGYTYSGVVANNPCARSRKADAAPVSEFWNGNGFIQLSGKKFARLIICRVDTSVGIVEFRRQAFIVGNGGFSFDLEPGQILGLDIGAGEVTSTFSATAATRTGVAGTYPTLFVGGETLTLGYDAASNFTVTFLAADQSAAQIAARINQYAGFSFADTSGGELRLTGVQRGTGGQVRVVSGSTGVIAQLGLTAANTAGTGNVVNIDAVSPAEVKTIVEAAVVGTLVQTQTDGKLRISKSFVGTTDTITVGASTTATALGFTVGQTNANATGDAGVIPAGTVVQNSAGTRVFVTMQDVTVTAANAGAYTVKVRHALDDGTGLSTNAATVTKVKDPVTLGSFSVTNPSLITASLTEGAIDALYSEAIDTTVDINTVSREINIIFSARQSNAVRKLLRSNVLDASANGCFGRMAIIRTPMNTPKAVAKSTTAEPGVGAYRDQRVVYVYPNVNTFVPLIARRGALSGGAGFTDDGNIDVGGDGFLATCMSQLAPEENPGQETTFTSNANGIESGANAQGFKINDYKAFKAAGICAPRMADGVLIFQSGVTSVDPGVNPQLKNIARRRMADFIQDTLARRGKGYGKKLSTFARRKALAGEMRMFLLGLLSANKPENQRIDGFTVDTKVNTKQSLGKGLYRIKILVRTLASLDSIVLDTTIGEQVIVDEVLPQAA